MKISPETTRTRKKLEKILFLLTTDKHNKHNIGTPAHSIFQTFLDISPISLLLDIGNKIIDRKGKQM